MIDDLDEALRRLLIRELPIKKSEIDIKFEQPKREWSARLSRPTLNLFLDRVHENTKLRVPQPTWEVIERRDDGTVVQKRKPVRVDLYYLITAWAQEPEDEHRLLTRALMALFRFPYMPPEVLPESLRGQPGQITMMVAQQEALPNVSDFWSAMDNEIRPALTCVITMALDPYTPITGPLVRTRELRFGAAEPPAGREMLQEAHPVETFWAVGGQVLTKHPLDKVRLVLAEAGLEVPVQPDGHFTIGRLRAGEYTLEVTADGGRPARQKLVVPSANYDLELK